MSGEEAVTGTSQLCGWERGKQIQGGKEKNGQFSWGVLEGWIGATVQHEGVCCCVAAGSLEGLSTAVGLTPGFKRQASCVTGAWAELEACYSVMGSIEGDSGPEQGQWSTVGWRKGSR